MIWGLAATLAVWPTHMIAKVTDDSCPSCRRITEHFEGGGLIQYRQLKRPQNPAPRCAACLNLQEQNG